MTFTRSLRTHSWQMVYTPAALKRWCWQLFSYSHHITPHHTTPHHTTPHHTTPHHTTPHHTTPHHTTPHHTTPHHTTPHHTTPHHTTPHHTTPAPVAISPYPALPNSVGSRHWTADRQSVPPARHFIFIFYRHLSSPNGHPPSYGQPPNDQQALISNGGKGVALFPTVFLVPFAPFAPRQVLFPFEIR